MTSEIISAITSAVAAGFALAASLQVWRLSRSLRDRLDNHQRSLSSIRDTLSKVKPPVEIAKCSDCGCSVARFQKDSDGSVHCANCRI